MHCPSPRSCAAVPSMPWPSRRCRASPRCPVPRCPGRPRDIGVGLVLPPVRPLPLAVHVGREGAGHGMSLVRPLLFAVHVGHEVAGHVLSLVQPRPAPPSSSWPCASSLILASSAISSVLRPLAHLLGPAPPSSPRPCAPSLILASPLISSVLRLLAHVPDSTSPRSSWPCIYSPLTFPPKARDGGVGTGLPIDAISLNRRCWL